MKVYFLGIAGSAMGNAALLLRSLGHEVSGSDQAAYPPMSGLLAEAGIRVEEGYDAARLDRLKPDLVVVGNAFSRGNPEVERLLELPAIPYASLPETLRRLVLAGRTSVVVAGTHGKTTTAALVAHLLRAAGTDPGFLVGGAPIDPPSGWAPGDPAAPFVIEGDEYDSAFFDKRSKFVHYAPRVAVFNNLEFDHADIFRDLEDVKKAFSQLLRLVPRSGYALVNGDDPNLRSLLPAPWAQVLRVGTGPDCDLRVAGYATSPEGSSFELLWRGRLWKRVRWPLIGLFNARNAAMASLAAALAPRPPPAGAAAPDPAGFPLDGLESFRGVRRRLQERHREPGLRLLEDFAHHPTAIRETLRALRLQNPRARLLAAFEPRSNTSRLESMRPAMQDALAQADEVLIGAPKRRPGEPGVALMDTQALARDLANTGVTAEAFDANEQLLQGLQARLARPLDPQAPIDLVVLSNGSFDGLVERLAASRQPLHNP